MSLQFNPFTGTFDVTTKGDTGAVAAAGDGSAAAPGITFASDTNTGIYRPGADQLALSTNGTGRLFVDASGNVGIGVSPATPLDTVGTFQWRSNVGGTDRWQRFTGGTGLIYDGTTTNTAIGFLTNGAERLRITSTGLVGIGTSSPGGLLHVQSNLAGNNQLILTNIASSNSGAGSEIVFTQGASGFAAGKIQCDREGSYSATVTSQDSALAFFTAADGVDSEKLRITSAGLVGIGTTSPGYLVTAATSADGVDGVSVESPSVNGVIRLRADGTNGNAIRVGGIGAQGNTLRFLVGSDVERARIDSSGRLLVGTSSGSHTLTVNGTSQIGASQQGTTSVASVSSGVATTVLTTSTPASGTKVIEVLVSAVAGTGNSVITARFLWQVNGQGGVNTRNVLRESITTSSDLNAGNRTYTNLTAAATTSGANEILQVTATHGGAIGFTSTLNVVYRTVLGSDYS